MLMLLRIAAKARQPVIVAAHLLGPHLDHRLRHGVGPAQRPQICRSFFRRRCIEIALPRHAGIPAMLAFPRLFEDQDIGAEIVGGERSGNPAAPNPATTTSASRRSELATNVRARSFVPVSPPGIRPRIQPNAELYRWMNA